MLSLINLFTRTQFSWERAIQNLNKLHLHKNAGSGAQSGKMLLVRIVDNNKIDAYCRVGYVK